jgi:hypothetical protein
MALAAPDVAQDKTRPQTLRMGPTGPVRAVCRRREPSFTEWTIQFHGVGHFEGKWQNRNRPTAARFA